MLKKTIQDLSEVSEEYRALYSEVDGTLTLNIEIEDTGVTGLKNNNQALKSEKLKLQARLNDLEDQMNQKTEEELASKGDYEELLATKEKAFQEKLVQANEKAEQATTLFRDSILDREVQKIATELAGDNAMLITPHLKSRLSVNEENQIAITDVLGNASLLTSADLVKEFNDNEIYKPLTQRASSGSGASGSETQNATTDVERYFNPQHADYSPTKQGDIEKSDPEIYKSMSSKFGLDDPFAPVGQRAYSPQNNQGAGVTFKDR